MFTIPKIPAWQKRATDISHVMDMSDDPAANYDDIQARMEQNQRDIDANWADDPAWSDASDDMKTAMAVASDAAGGTEKTGDLLPKAKAVQAEKDPDKKIRKQNDLADNIAILVGKNLHRTSKARNLPPSPIILPIIAIAATKKAKTGPKTIATGSPARIA